MTNLPHPSQTIPATVTNQLLDSLPSKQRQKFIARCEHVDLVFGTILSEVNEPFRHVYFPLVSFISLVATLDGHKPLENGLIGNEGMLGASLLLGVNAAPGRSLVQGAGTAFFMSTAQFRRELAKSPQLTSLIKRYLFTLMSQLSQAAACIRFHSIEQRLARWLLMTHDRAHADHFYLTQDFLADMLGVRRSGVSVAAGALRLKHYIDYVRGEIHIQNRKGLEATACQCYQVLIDDYARLI